VFRFPVLPFLVGGGKQGDTQITQETPDSVVPGIRFIRVAHHVLRNVRQFLDQRAVGLTWFGIGVIEVITPRHRIAALGVGVGERDKRGHTGAKLATLVIKDASV
jgi:hypothetical protein